MSFKEVYEAVFDADGNIKACGRESCKRLIIYIRDRFHTTVGNVSTGFITDVDTIRNLYLIDR